MNPINSQIWEKYSAPAIKSDRNTKNTFVKYRFANLVEKKERNSKRRGKEREHPQNAPFHISYQPTRSRIHKKQSQLLKKKRGRINDICYFGCFLKNSKITQSKEEHITKICQI